MIEFSNGHQLQFACGSGALAFDGRGWWWEQHLRWAGKLDPTAFTVVAKTVTMRPKKGNLSMWHPWTCVRMVCFNDTEGSVNAVGLTNPGIRTWIQKHYPVAIKHGYRIAASVKPEDSVEALDMERMLRPLDLAYIEANISCPNVPKSDDLQKVVRVLRRLGDGPHPVVLKLSTDQVRQEFIAATEEYVEAYHAINTVPWDRVFRHEPTSPIQKYSHGLKGGVAGQWISGIAIESLKMLKRMTDRPIISGGGIWELSDVVQREKEGASAFSIGSLFMHHPGRPNLIVKQYEIRNGYVEAREAEESVEV